MSDAMLGVMSVIGLAIVAFVIAGIRGFWDKSISFDDIYRHPLKFFRSGEWDPIVHILVSEEAYLISCELDSPNSVEFDKLQDKQEARIWELLEQQRQTALGRCAGA